MKTKEGTKIKPARRLCMVLLVVALSANLVSAAEKSKPGTIEFKPKVAALFKNGLGFFVCEGEGKVGQDGEIISDFIPNASFGAFWLASLDPDVVVKSARAAKQDVKRSVSAISIAELLRANTDKDVAILYDNEWIRGKILSLTEPSSTQDEEPEMISSDYRSSIAPRSVWAPSGTEPTLLLLETRKGEFVALNINSIRRVNFVGDFERAFERTQQEKILSIYTETQKPTTHLQMSFLQKGIAWVPSYNVDIADDLKDPSGKKKARISMQALVVNDALDLEDAELHFIVGYPNLQYADILSPISLQQTLAQMIQNLLHPDRRAGFGGVTSQVAVMSNVAFSGEGDMALARDIMGYSTSGAEGLEGTHEEDLYFYSLKDYTLKKGERGYINLFSADADYKHIYVWSVPKTVEEIQSRRSADEDTQKDEVWHCIKLKNSTPHPWTTGAAFTSRGWKPLGQDTLRYTPRGGETNLRITQVTDIRVSRKEFETERQQKSIRLLGYDWDLVTVKGELLLKSYKQKSVEMEITKQLLGEVLETTDNGVVTKRAEGLRAVNPNSEIEWKVTLEPGEEKTITYVFKIYVR